MERERVAIRPEMYRWARERAGYEHAQPLANRFPHLANWEAGTHSPTLKQLEAFANAMHAPIGFFFLSQPPQETIPIPDFRTVRNTPMKRPSPDLLETIYICQQRQEWYRNYQRSLGEDMLPFAESVHVSDSIVSTAARIRHELRFDLNERRAASTWSDALRLFVEQAEAIGVLVMSSGAVLNNNRRLLDVDEFRGFALCDSLAPLIFINGADSKSAQMFTLAHELVHIWLGQSALSDSEAAGYPSHDQNDAAKIEVWCNAVAAELLVPLDAIKMELRTSSQLEEEVQRLARIFKVSTLVLLRRMYDAEAFTREAFWNYYRNERDRLRAIAEAKRQEKKPGGDFYSTLGVRTSKRFTRSLITSTLEGQTMYRDAMKMLGISKLSTFEAFAQKAGVVR